MDGQDAQDFADTRHDAKMGDRDSALYSAETAAKKAVKKAVKKTAETAAEKTAIYLEMGWQRPYNLTL
jgi:HEPN domain-containing protein